MLPKLYIPMLSQVLKHITANNTFILWMKQTVIGEIPKHGRVATSSAGLMKKTHVVLEKWR
jgi:hypothetical protein